MSLKSLDRVADAVSLARECLESGEPDRIAGFLQETGVDPLQVCAWASEGKNAEIERALDENQPPPRLQFQDAWDKALAQGNRRLAMRALHAQLNIQVVDSSINRGGAHDAPGPDSGAPLWDVSGSGTYPEDIYTSVGLRYYATGDDKKDVQAYVKIRNLEASPNKQVVVYRAVEKDGDAKKIIPGDWVTPIRSYAELHGEAHISGDYKIMSKTVRARDLFTGGDSWLEWGYHPQPFLPELRHWKERSFQEMVDAKTGLYGTPPLKEVEPVASINESHSPEP